ncbi:hypothetical protein L227DRAFT_300658 [Lentinus tigrinus ALCF2SS1-6]|uniref:Uncharacterized protein n=1 Tax=Lentinus tigrinus ALCF2SS1-6 TaxID=1328759 RepID=A0A5C2RXK8_9APHY|nr:hypothetical protein L227DRAFT_300658 [Lentinus tigrinus ALCF2SS1-6]
MCHSRRVPGCKLLDHPHDTALVRTSGSAEQQENNKKRTAWQRQAPRTTSRICRQCRMSIRTRATTLCLHIHIQTARSWKIGRVLDAGRTTTHAAQHTRPAQCSRQGNGNALHALETQLRVANAFMNQFRLVARAPGPNNDLRIHRSEQPSA